MINETLMKSESIEAYTNKRIAKLTSTMLGLIIATPAFVIVVTEILGKII